MWIVVAEAGDHCLESAKLEWIIHTDREKWNVNELPSRRTVLSRPSVMSITKKRIEKKTEPYIVAIASGYTMNTKPGPRIREDESRICKLVHCSKNFYIYFLPSGTTELISLFSFFDMKPRIEKVTKPATKLLKQLTLLVKIASLMIRQIEKNN